MINAILLERPLDHSNLGRAKSAANPSSGESTPTSQRQPLRPVNARTPTARQRERERCTHLASGLASAHAHGQAGGRTCGALRDSLGASCIVAATPPQSSPSSPAPPAPFAFVSAPRDSREAARRRLGPRCVSLAWASI
jgi:hypothetical protein